MTAKQRGKYIVFEGGEGVGKSTQSKILAEERNAQLVWEPGATGLGTSLRSILLDPSIQTTPMTEVLLFAAQRAQLMDEVVNPSLEAGRDVVSDRSWISSAAYQGARGQDIGVITEVNRLAIGEQMMRPDVVFLFDADPEDMTLRRDAIPDYFERMSGDFHQEVRNNFKTICAGLGAFTLNAALDVATITSQINEHLSALDSM